MPTQSIKEKTAKQIQAIFGLGRKANLEKEQLEDLADKRLSMLTFDEANALIVRLGGEPFPSDQSRRTVNYHRQQAGVVTMATPQHLAKMDKLAADRGMTSEGLERMCRRMLQTPRPLTAKGCNAVTEALKSMNKRDAISRRSALKEAA